MPPLGSECFFLECAREYRKHAVTERMMSLMTLMLALLLLGVLMVTAVMQLALRSASKLLS